MKKIYFNKKTLKIQGATEANDPSPFDDGIFAFVETKEDYHSLTNLGIVKSGKKYILKVLKG